MIAGALLCGTARVASWGVHSCNVRSTTNASDILIGFGGATLGLEVML